MYKICLYDQASSPSSFFPSSFSSAVWYFVFSQFLGSPGKAYPSGAILFFQELILHSLRLWLSSSAGIIDQARSLARHVLPTFCFHSILTEPDEAVGERTGDLLDRGERDDADRSDLGVPTEARGESNEIMSTRFAGPELASTLLIQHS